MNYNRVLHIFNIALFSALWFFDNSDCIRFTVEINDPMILCTRLMSTFAGYHDSIFRVAIVLTILFSASFFSNFKQDSALKILKYGRENFVFYSAKKVSQFSFLFTLEFWVVDLMFTMLFCEFSMLLEYRYFICSVLYFFTRFLYFFLCGLILLLFKLSLNFKKQYIYIGCLLLLAGNSLPYLMIDKGIVLFSDFINDWMLKAEFNYIEYIKNIFVFLLLVAVIIILSKLIFAKKDILIYEEEN